MRVQNRETRQGWPLLTVETDVNGDLKGTDERGPSLVGSLGLSCLLCTKDFCSVFVALVGPVKNTFFLTVHYSNYFVAIAQQTGQAAVLGRLPLSVCPWFKMML